MIHRLIINILLTSIVVVAISEMAKRSVWLGAIRAALPLTSLLALTWLWIDTHEGEKVAGFSMGVFWAVPPTLAFFPSATENILARCRIRRFLNDYLVSIAFCDKSGV